MDPLDRLAGRLGIELEFEDAHGRERRPSATVKRRLLASMGVRVRHTADVEKALEELDEREWSQPLHAQVTPQAQLPAAVPVTYPGGTSALRWRVEEEHGRTHGGSARFADLPLIAHRGGREQRRLTVDAVLPVGRHRLHVEASGRDETASASLIVVPGQCYLPAPLARGERAWALSVQLYMLRSRRNWGIGDFTDLKNLAGIAGRLGASAIALNPLHAGFLDAAHASPYSPASRLFLNVLYIDVTAVPELADCAAAAETMASRAFQRDLEARRDAELIDYEAVARLKLPLLEQLFTEFVSSARSHSREAFAAFRRERGNELERFCVWQALREHFAERAGGDWRRWPRAYRDAGSDAVARFAERHRERIDFFAWLQWVAEQQLADAAAAARDAGLGIGLYRDLAVGADGAGAESWADAPLYADGASAGAPADLFNPAGQSWGLPPLIPHALRERGYPVFDELIRANMRHAGAMRIDHAMALMRLYWVADGRPPAEGAYVRYPLDALAGLVALESRRRRCAVVGEDLGTVPRGFSDAMTQRGMLSYRIVFFEQDEDGRLNAPEAYPELALAALGSHDLAPLRGWWEGRDIELKQRHSLYPDEATHREQRERRARDRRALLEALSRTGIAVPDGLDADSGYDSALNVAAHAFLARTRSMLAVVQLDDLLEERDLVNLPASTVEYPNWRRRHGVPLEEIEQRPLVQSVAALMREMRPALSDPPG